MKEKRAFALVLLVGEVNVIEPPRGIHSSSFRVVFLLPIEPPEVNSLCFQWMVQQIEIVLRKLSVREVKRNKLLRRRIDSHVACELRVRIFPRLHAARGMKIECHLQAFVVQLSQEVLRIGEEGVVPGVAAPAFAMARLILDLEVPPKSLMPVHIDHEDIEWNTILMKAGDEVAQFLIAVGPVARPPRSERIAWRQRDASGNAYIVAERPLVVMTVSEEIEILPRPRGPRQHPRLGCGVTMAEVEIRGVKKRPGIIHHDPSVP
jgi:hypothetical protein